MNWIVTPATYLFLASTALAAAALAAVWRRRAVPGGLWLLLGVAAILAWNLCALLDASSADLAGRIFWAKLEYLGANVSMPLLLLFFVQFPRPLLRLPRAAAGLFLVPCFTILAVLTNEAHGLFWSGFTPLPTPVNGYIFHPGPLYVLSMAYNYLCGTLILFILIRNVRRFHGLYRLQFAMQFAFGLVPFFAGLVYLLRLGPLSRFDLLPAAFALGSLGLALNIRFLRLLDLVPIGRNLLVEKLSDGVVVVDLQGRILDINPAARRLLGVPALKVGAPLEDLPAPFSDCFDGRGRVLELVVDQPERRFLQVVSSPLTDELGQPVGCLTLFRDMTAMRGVELALHDSQERYRSLIEDVVDATPAALCISAADHRLIWENSAAADLWGRDRARVPGADMRDLLKAHNAGRLEHGAMFVERVLESYQTGQHLENVELHFAAAPGCEERWVLYSSRPIRVGYYAGGRIEQYVDITAQKALLARIEALAFTDALTGIYNRRSLFEIGRHDFDQARRAGSDLSAIFFDIDYFKELNDRHGHSTGDQVLVALTARIQNHIRAMDIFARYGGEEFIILLPGMTLTQAGRIAERIRRLAADAPVSAEGLSLPVTISIGAAHLAPGEDLSALFHRADQAMYRAKQNGRNRVELDPDPD